MWKWSFVFALLFWAPTLNAQTIANTPSQSFAFPNLLPCDALALQGTPCVAAHSLTRRLFQAYAGSLFQIQRASDSATLNIGTSASGSANVSGVAAFCAATSCNVSIIYDQAHTPASGNNLPQAITAGQAPYGTVTLANGSTVPIAVISSGEFYRNRASTVGIPIGSSAITEYMVVATSKNATCCGTYGDMEATVADTGNGHMFALAYSTGAEGVSGTGPGPWPGVDWENGVYMYGPTPNAAYISVLAKYTTTGPAWTLKYSDATQGFYTLAYSGALPGGYTADFEGGISLGEGGDGSAAPVSFLEGVIVAATTNDTADNMIQANLRSFYGIGTQ